MLNWCVSLPILKPRRSSSMRGGSPSDEKLAALKLMHAWLPVLDEAAGTAVSAIEELKLAGNSNKHWTSTDRNFTIKSKKVTD